MFAWRKVANENRKKMRVLSGLEGRDVILGVSRGFGRVEFIVPRQDQLRVEDAAGKSVVLAGEKQRRIILEQIRWIEDPLTGTRYDGPW